MRVYLALPERTFRVLHEPSDWVFPATELTSDELFDALGQMVRGIVRDELSKGRFLAVSPWLTIEETCAYLKMSRARLSEIRTERKCARTPAAKAKVFPPDRKRAGKIYLDRRELDAWMAGG